MNDSVEHKQLQAEVRFIGDYELEQMWKQLKNPRTPEHIANLLRIEIEGDWIIREAYRSEYGFLTNFWEDNASKLNWIPWSIRKHIADHFDLQLLRWERKNAWFCSIIRYYFKRKYDEYAEQIREENADY
jgi:hypothetical protein